MSTIQTARAVLSSTSGSLTEATFVALAFGIKTDTVGILLTAPDLDAIHLLHDDGRYVWRRTGKLRILLLEYIGAKLIFSPIGVLLELVCEWSCNVVAAVAANAHESSIARTSTALAVVGRLCECVQMRACSRVSTRMSNV